MINKLDMVAVAEGVDTDEVAAKLSELGCTYGQSYLFGPPITADMAQRCCANASRWWGPRRDLDMLQHVEKRAAGSRR